MGDKHKDAKHDTRHAEHGRHEHAKKDKDKHAKPAGKDSSHEMPGAAGFISAGAEEDTYD